MKNRRSAALLVVVALCACHAGTSGSATPPVVPPFGIEASRSVEPQSGVTTKIIFSGFAGAAYVAMHDGSAYVTDVGNHALKKVAPDGTVSMVSADFAKIAGVAVDQSGTPYVAAQNRVYRLSPSGRHSIFKADSSWNPRGIAVDSQDNVYIATAQSQIRKVAPDGTVTLVGRGFSYPIDVAVDATGAVYVADSSRILIVRGHKVENVKERAPGFKYINPVGVDVDQSGNIYVADGYSDALFKLTPHVGGTFLGYFYGGIHDVALTSQGIPFVTDSNAGLFKVTASQTINVAYSAPRAVGTDPNGNVYAATINAYKIASNGKVTQIAPASQLGNYRLGGIAADAGGNVYVSSSGNGQTIYKISPKGLVTTFVSGSGLGILQQLAVDSSSNVYVADSGNGQVVEFSPSGTKLHTWYAYDPYGVAVDAQNNVYFTSGTRVVKVTRSGLRVVGGGFQTPVALAIDPSSNIYVADFQANAVYEIRKGKGGNVPVGSGFVQPISLATDAAGNLYVADFGHGKIKELILNSR